MKTKPIKDLYYRFIKGTDFDSVVEPQTLALWMHDIELITLIPNKGQASIDHYLDTDKFGALSTEEKELKILRLMESKSKGSK